MGLLRLLYSKVLIHLLPSAYQLHFQRGLLLNRWLLIKLLPITLVIFTMEEMYILCRLQVIGITAR